MTIRDAYRRRAREHHPDRGGAASADEMAAINEAYRVLADAGRRALYDRQHLDGPGAGPGRVRTDGGGPPSSNHGAPPHAPGLLDTSPARMPWRFMAAMAGVGVAVVLVGAALIEPPGPDRPDGLLQPGSCVAVEANNTVREVSCDGDEELVVDRVVPFDASCPGGTAGFPDAQGLGLACVVAARGPVATVAS